MCASSFFCACRPVYFPTTVTRSGLGGSTMGRGIAGVIAAMIAAAPMIAVAAPITTTKYQYYNCSDKTAADIYSTMLSRGPHVNGEQAYASTTAQSSQAGSLIPGRSCRIRDYQLRMSF